MSGCEILNLQGKSDGAKRNWFDCSRNVAYLHVCMSIIWPPMTQKAIALAAKLLSEGERIVQFFAGLSDAQWQARLYDHGAKWDVRGVFEHLIISERQLLQLFEVIVRTGIGSPEGMDVDHLNLERTGTLSLLSYANLLLEYTLTRQQTVEFIHGLVDDQLALQARHPAIGISALEDQLKLVYLHHQMHVRDIKKAL